MLKPSVYLLLSAALFTAGCQPKEAATPATASAASAATAASVPTVAASAPAPFTTPKPDDLLAQFNWYRARAEHDLAGATPAQADALYVQFSADIDELLKTLTEREQKVLENYYDYWTYDEKTDTHHPKPNIKKRVAELAAADLEYWYVGEGMAEVRPQADYYWKLFGKHVSPDYADFLRIEAEQNKTLVFNDAAIVISWAQLGKYVMDWEGFLQRHAKSKLATRARCLYGNYASAYLLGANNTPVRDYDTKVLQPEVKAEWQRLRQQHPESPVAKLTLQAEAMEKEDEASVAKLLAPLNRPDSEACYSGV